MEDSPLSGLMITEEEYIFPLFLEDRFEMRSDNCMITEPDLRNPLTHCVYVDDLRLNMCKPSIKLLIETVMNNSTKLNYKAIRLVAYSLLSHKKGKIVDIIKYLFMNFNKEIGNKNTYY